MPGLPFDLRPFDVPFLPLTLPDTFLEGIEKALSQPLLGKARGQPRRTLQAALRPVGRPPHGLARHLDACKCSFKRVQRRGCAPGSRQRAQPRAEGRPADLLGEEPEALPVRSEGDSFKQRLPERFLLAFAPDDRDERGRLAAKTHIAEALEGGGNEGSAVARQRGEAWLVPESGPLEPTGHLLRAVLGPIPERGDRRRFASW